MLFAEPVRVLEQLLEVAADLDTAGAVQIAEVQVGVSHELEQSLAVMDPDDDGAVTRRHVGLVPKRDADRRVAEPLDDLAHQPAVDAFRAVSVCRDVGQRVIVGVGDAERFVACSVHRY